jgi:hypothetical protein
MLSSLHWYQEYNDETRENGPYRVASNHCKHQESFWDGDPLRFCFCLSFLEDCGGGYILFEEPLVLKIYENCLSSHFFLALGILLHYYYCFDCFGFPLLCLHLLPHALYLLGMDFHPCLYMCTGFIYCEPVLKIITSYQFQCQSGSPRLEPSWVYLIISLYFEQMYPWPSSGAPGSKSSY